MHLIDYILIGIVAIAIIGAFIAVLSGKSRGNCCGNSGCGGSCSGCSKCKKCKK